MMLILPVHELSICFHLFVSSSVSSVFCSFPSTGLLGLMVRFLIYLELTFICNIRSHFFFFLLVDIQFSHSLMKRLSFSHYMVLALLSKEHLSYLQRFVSGLFCSISLCVCLHASFD